jgi:hypothetical protein
VRLFLKRSSVLAFGLATIGLVLILPSQFFSLEFVSKMCVLGLAMVGLAFFSGILLVDYMVFFIEWQDNI